MLSNSWRLTESFGINLIDHSSGLAKLSLSISIKVDHITDRLHLHIFAAATRVVPSRMSQTRRKLSVTAVNSESTTRLAILDLSGDSSDEKFFNACIDFIELINTHGASTLFTSVAVEDLLSLVGLLLSKSPSFSVENPVVVCLKLLINSHAIPVVKATLSRLFSIGLLSHFNESFILDEIEIYNSELLSLWTAAKEKIAISPQIKENCRRVYEFILGLVREPTVSSLEILSCLLSNPICRKYLLIGVKDLNVLHSIEKFYPEKFNSFRNEIYDLPYDPFAEVDLSYEELSNLHLARIQNLQLAIFENFSGKVLELSLLNPNQVGDESVLRDFLASISDEEFDKLSTIVSIFGSDRDARKSSFIYRYTKPINVFERFSAHETGLSHLSSKLLLRSIFINHNFKKNMIMDNALDSITAGNFQGALFLLETCSILEKTEIDVIHKKTRTILAEAMIKSKDRINNLFIGQTIYLLGARSDASGSSPFEASLIDLVDITEKQSAAKINGTKVVSTSVKMDHVTKLVLKLADYHGDLPQFSMIFVLPDNIDDRVKALELALSHKMDDKFSESLIGKDIFSGKMKNIDETAAHNISILKGLGQKIEEIEQLSLNGKTLILFKDKNALNLFLGKSVKNGLDLIDFSNELGSIEAIESIRADCLSKVQNLCDELNVSSEYAYSCETALMLKKHIVEPRWAGYLELLENWGIVKTKMTIAEIASEFPFGKLDSGKIKDIKKVRSEAEARYNGIMEDFDIIGRIRPVDLLTSNERKIDYLISREARIILIDERSLFLIYSRISRLQLKVERLVVADNVSLDSSLIAMTCLPNLKNVVLLSDLFSQRGSFAHHLDCNCKVATMKKQDPRPVQPSIVNLYKHLGVDSVMKKDDSLAGMKRVVQLIDVKPETTDKKEGIFLTMEQNYAEAEYAVALFQYLRLSGHSSDDIVILTGGNSQKNLISDILEHRCDWTNFYKRPVVTNSLDSPKPIVIISMNLQAGDKIDLFPNILKATKGLYILAGKNLFQTMYPLLSSKFPAGNHLEVVRGKKTAEIPDFEALGSLVYELSQKLEE